METFCNNEHPQNAYFSIFLTEFGIVILLNEVHDANVKDSNAFKVAEKVILFKLVHPLKQPSCIFVTEEGITNEIIEEQSKNAYSPISFTELGILISIKEVHSKNDLFQSFLKKKEI